MTIPLWQKLKDVRHTIDVPKGQQWLHRVEVKTAHGDVIDDVNQISEEAFPVSVCWRWLRREEFAKCTLRGRLNFYWKGLTHNTALRAKLLRLKSRLKVLTLKSSALIEEMIDDEQEAAE